MESRALTAGPGPVEQEKRERLLGGSGTQLSGLGHMGVSCIGGKKEQTTGRNSVNSRRGCSEDTLSKPGATEGTLEVLLLLITQERKLRLRKCFV